MRFFSLRKSNHLSTFLVASCLAAACGASEEQESDEGKESSVAAGTGGEGASGPAKEAKPADDSGSGGLSSKSTTTGTGGDDPQKTMEDEEDEEDRSMGGDAGAPSTNEKDEDDDEDDGVDHWSQTPVTCIIDFDLPESSVGGIVQLVTDNRGMFTSLELNGDDIIYARHGSGIYRIPSGSLESLPILEEELVGYVSFRVHDGVAYWREEGNVLRSLSLSTPGATPETVASLDLAYTLYPNGDFIYLHTSSLEGVRRIPKAGGDIEVVIETGSYQTLRFGGGNLYVNPTETFAHGMWSIDENDFTVSSLLSDYEVRSFVIEEGEVFWGDGSNLYRTRLDDLSAVTVITEDVYADDIHVLGDRVYWNDESVDVYGWSLVDGSDCTALEINTLRSSIQQATTQGVFYVGTGATFGEDVLRFFSFGD